MRLLEELERDEALKKFGGTNTGKNLPFSSLSEELEKKKEIVKLAIVKSEILKQLKKSYPNFLQSDLDKLVNIIISEIKNALKRGERVELRNSFGVFYTNIQKKSIRRNPKTGEKVMVPEKKTIHWKYSKEIYRDLNEEE